MADTISYQYAALSALQRAADQDELCLAKYSEIEKKDAPCFFWGKLTQPYMTARCLIALSNVVQSSFNLTPAQLSMLKDPIVTASNNHQHPLSARLNREEREIYAELLSVNNSKSESGYILHLLDVWKGTANLKKAVANIRR